jgi:GNAT superfamily N-acetyltransferase
VFLDATIENGTIYLSQISVEKRASGLGTQLMAAIRALAERRRYRVLVYKVTNHAFFDRFDWLQPSKDRGSYEADFR